MPPHARWTAVEQGSVDGHQDRRMQEGHTIEGDKAARAEQELEDQAQGLEDQAQEAGMSPAEHAEYEAAILDLARCTIVCDLAIAAAGERGVETSEFGPFLSVVPAGLKGKRFHPECRRTR